MDPVDIGILSVIAIVVTIYLGVYIPVALAGVSFVTIWLVSDKPILAVNFLRQAIGDSVTEYEFATIPLFTFMGLIVSKAGLGTDVYRVMNQLFQRIRGGVGMATVGANALFAAVTGSSIASASPCFSTCWATPWPMAIRLVSAIGSLRPSWNGSG